MNISELDAKLRVSELVTKLLEKEKTIEEKRTNGFRSDYIQALTVKIEAEKDEQADISKEITSIREDQQMLESKIKNLTQELNEHNKQRRYIEEELQETMANLAYLKNPTRGQ